MLTTCGRGHQKTPGRDCRECTSLMTRERRVRRQEQPVVVPADYQCRRCHEIKPSSAFQPDAGRLDGLRVWCRACMADYNRLRTFGVSPERYAELLELQGGGCAICGESERLGTSFSVDHDHKTGMVRGLLCRACNAAIGGLKDDVAVLQRAIDYLRGNV